MEVAKKIVKNLQKIKHSQYKVSFLNGTFFEASEELILEYKIVVSKDITNMYDKIILKIPFYTFYQKALNYSLKNCKNTYQVRNYLIKNKCKKDFIDLIIAKLVTKKIIDDKKYALMYTNSLVNKKYGKYYIENKLKSLNINSEYIIKSIDSINEEVYVNNLNDLVAKKMLYYKTNDENTILKLKRYLVARGYENKCIIDVIDSINN